LIVAELFHKIVVKKVMVRGKITKLQVCMIETQGSPKMVSENIN